MSRRLLSLLLAAGLALAPLLAATLHGTPDDEERISGRVERTAAGERIVVHEVLIEAPVADVWAAHTTPEGWAAWSSPVMEIDLRVGGTIRTHYVADATIGDPGTNTLHIVNYVPERVLTLRADLSDNWPEVMKQDADRMSNVILFEALGPERTRLTSYGVGYRDSPEYDDLLEFFVKANADLYRGLIASLED